jgi:hypothetical protein
VAAPRDGGPAGDGAPGITEQSAVTFQAPEDVGPLTPAGKRDVC